MQKQIFAMALIIVLVAASWHPGFSLKYQDGKDNPTAIEDYDFVARGKMSQERGARPEQIARMDNNGEILLACLDAKTPGQLKSVGISFLQSQLELLVDWNLLEYDRKKKTYKTTIHVYGIEKASAIRKHVDAAVKELADELNSDLISLKNYLQRFDYEKNLFAILYAYVLHGYAMRQFGDEIYRQPQLSEKNPFWNGYAWAIYPVKKFDTGVISLPADGNQFYIVASTAIPRIDFRLISALVKDIATDDRVDDTELKESLSSFGLFDDEGNLTLPIFDRDWSGKLETMAKKVYDHMIDLVDSGKMKDILGMATQARAAMFIHYEIRYALLDYLLEKGTIPAPIDFENSAANESSDVRNLVFMMKPGK